MQVLLARYEELTDALLQEIRAMRQEIADLVSVLKMERPADGAPPVQVVMPPISPDMLNDVLQTMAWRAKYFHPTFRLSVAVPAGTTVEFPFPLPEGFYCTKRTPITFESDYYDPNIVVNVYVDGKGPENLVTPYGAVMYPPGSVVVVNFGEMWLKKRNVIMEFKNGSAADATITFDVAASLIHYTLYESWYRPIVEFTKARLNDAARAMGGEAV